MTHAEYIQLIQSFDAKFTPELKAPEVTMPFDGDYTHEMHSAQMFAEYKAAGISPRDVLAQTFSLSDILLWNRTEPDFARLPGLGTRRIEAGALIAAVEEHGLGRRWTN
jgi:glycerophosphoryl diester phosphodiesterase